MLQVLPQTHTLGTLSPHTLHMELPDASRDALKDSMEGRAPPLLSEIYAHECQHFQDIVGTAWGQGYLDNLFGAYDAVLAGEAEGTLFHKLIAQFDLDRSILFPSYYKYVMPNAPKGNAVDRWRMDFSTGARFRPDGQADEEMPIMFVRFDKGDEHVARQPITVGSLLEMRALGIEFGAFSRFLNRLSHDEAIVSESVKGREMISQFYDPQMTTYSVAAHIAGNVLGDHDIIAMSDAAFKASQIALNLTANGFGKIVHPKAMGELPYKRLRGFKNSRDRGYAFLTLIFNLRDLFKDLVNRDAMEQALELSGMPPIGKVYELAQASIGKRKANLRHLELAAIRDKLTIAGLALCQEPRFDRLSLYPASKAMPAPIVMTEEDLSWFHVGAPVLTENETEFLYSCLSRLRESQRLALRAARGFEFGWTDYVY